MKNYLKKKIRYVFGFELINFNRIVLWIVEYASTKNLAFVFVRV